MRYLLLLLIGSLCLLGSLPAKADTDLMPHAELVELNKAINNSTYYRQRLIHTLDSMKRVARQSTDPAVKWRKTLDIADKFGLMNADSAIFYAEAAYRIGLANNNKEQTVEALIAVINALSRAGLYTVAKSNFEIVLGWGIPSNLKTEFWMAGALLYNNMISEMGEKAPYAEETREEYNAICDSLLAYLPHSNPHYRRMKIDRMIKDGRYAEARENGERLLSELKEVDRQYGLTAIQLADICARQGDQQNFASYLAKSATSDIKAGVTDGMALPALANWLYENDGLDEAYRYVNYALWEASSGSAKTKTFAIAELVPNIETAYRKKIDASHRQVVVGLIIVALLLIATTVLIVVLLRQNKRAQSSRVELARISKVQESYMGNFIALCSSYANRLDSVNQLVGRKLSSGQADELLKMVKAGKLDSTSDDEDFNKLFDVAFLDMYPNFVTNVNSLLRPDAQIELKDDKSLTPELRIYAFVKLGVDESVKIAQILRYSVSTVYAYRNRMRNRAVDRENFDAEVAKVGR